MLVGYVLEQILGLVLGVVVLASRRSPRRLSAAHRVLISFHDCALFFAFSIQIAAIVVLIREDFGISTADMGNATVYTTQAVSVLVLLPLLYVLMLRSNPTASNSLVTAATRESENVKHTQLPSLGLQRFFLVLICWLLSFWPFYSSMNAWFAPSKIGKVISITFFSEVQGMCMVNINKIENRLMSAFELLAFIPISLFLIGRVVWLGTGKHHGTSRPYLALEQWRNTKEGQKSTGIVQKICFVSLPLIACGLLWTIFRARKLQIDMAGTNNVDDRDNQWTFGQVVAVTLFVPVIVEAWNAWKEQDPGDRDD